MVAMKKFKAVIFDLDDTLYPEMEYVISGFKVVSQYISEKINIESQEIFCKCLKLFEEDRANVFDRLLRLYGVNKDELMKECLRLYREHYPCITLSREAKELLVFLRMKGIKIGILTDGRPEGQWNKIKALGLEKYCDYIIVTDELGGIEYRKPCEIPYKKMLQELGIQAQEAIYVGDNIAKDFVAPNKLGMFTIMLENNKGLYRGLKVSNEYLAKSAVSEIIEIKELLELA